MLILQIDTQSSIPIYAQIVDRVMRLAREGELTSDAALPSVRQLASDLEINPNTVARAYRELERHGVIKTAGRRGTRVASGAEERARQALATRLDEIVSRVLRETAHLGYDPDVFVEALTKRLETDTGKPHNPGSKT
jgi:GntR family transcriptional regulator